MFFFVVIYLLLIAYRLSLIAYRLSLIVYYNMVGCNFCFNMRKSNYDTHRMKDSSGNTTCPVLLNTKCLNCNYYGHTAKYCTITDEMLQIMVSRTIPTIRAVVDVDTGVDAVVGVFDNTHDLKTGLCGEYIKPLNTDEVEVVSDLGAFQLKNIIWGVGSISMIGKRWSDMTTVY